MSIQLGQIAPDIEQDSTQGRIRFHEWPGDSWGLFFSHPKNFTPVCTTELGEVARRSEEHTYELQSLMRISYAVICLIKTIASTRYFSTITDTSSSHNTHVQYMT